MYSLILSIHVFIAVCIVLLVLVQQGKGSTVGAAFGSGASQTVFGSRGSGSFLFRLTTGLLIFFFLTSMTLNYLTVHSYKKVVLPVQQQQTKSPVLPSEIPIRK